MKNFLIYFIGATLFMACKKEEDTNPFDEQVVENPNVIIGAEMDFSIGTFPYLHQKIFRSTCANSGCHDGTFPPDFRTLNSSYNTLVNQGVINNDPSGTYSLRVKPGDANLSFLSARLMYDIPNLSGAMPLEVDPGSDYNEMKTVYIQAVNDWINNGAKDAFGNDPGTGSLMPQVTGMLAFPTGNITTPFSREIGPGVTSVEVPQGSADIWFTVNDDQTPSADILVNEVYLSIDKNDFSSSSSKSLTITSPINGNDIGGSSVEYTHKIPLDLSGYSVGDVIYFLVKVNDEDHATPSEIPGVTSTTEQKTYFSIKII